MQLKFIQKQRKFIYLALLVFLIGLVFFLVKNRKIRDWSAIEDAGILRVSTDYSLVNYFVTDSVQGFQYELVSALCDSLGIKAQWTIENSLEDNIADLKRGEIDLIARNIPVTSVLREELAFSHPILHVQQVLVQRKATYNNGIEPLRNQLLLAKKNIFVPENSPSILRLKNLETEIADTIFINEMPEYEEEQLMIMVAKGDIDFAVCDAQTAKINAALLPELDIKTAISFTQMQAWAIRPSSTQLKVKVDSFLIRFLQTKAYRDIYRKYYK